MEDWMNVVLWILQILLAIVFLMHGLLFLNPPPDIAVQMDASFPRWFQLFLGVAEVAAGIGLTLPGVTRIKPYLVAWAADGICMVLVPATVLHLVRAEWSSALITFVLLLMALYVAYMRHVRMPIRPRR